jgi:tRNA (guanine37-N1)-methyltransferase
MKRLGWRVARPDAERVRQILRGLGYLAEGWNVAHDGGDVLFPLGATPGPDAGALPGGTVEWEFAESGRRGPASYRERLHWTAPDAERLPRAFDVVGDIVLIRLPAEIVGRSAEIGDALLAAVPGARLVGRDEGVKGPERRRQLVRIAGEGEFRTVHHENGLALDVDLERAYFSPRLAREHARVAQRVAPGERVFDLCCGVGPFTLTIARRGVAKEIQAVDANPEAIALLQRNLARLHHPPAVRPILADLAAFLPSAGVAERVVFNLPHEGIKYLTSVGKSVARAGTLHYYEMTGREEYETRPPLLIGALGGPSDWTLSDRHVVHPYSPQADLVAYAFVRAGE